MARRRRGGGTPATEALAAAGVAHELRPYEHDPRAASYGLEAAEALGVEPERVFKTLLVDLGPGGPGGSGGPAAGGRARLGVGVVPVARRLDLKAVAAALGAKRAELADPAVASRVTGYVVGGISPIGQRSQLPTVVDDSATTHRTILVSGGRRGLDVELAPDDLVGLLGATYASIAR